MTTGLDLREWVQELERGRGYTVREASHIWGTSYTSTSERLHAALRSGTVRKLGIRHGVKGAPIEWCRA